jgi:hypothetical protein
MLVGGGRLAGVSSSNQMGSDDEAPYTMVEDFTTNWRTRDSGADTAASRFMVPMTLISWIARSGI